MIVRCPDCRSTYEVTSQKVPESGLKVRCPRCKTVFPVTGGQDARGEGGEVSSLRQPPPPPPPEDRVTRPRRAITDPALARRMARAMISEMLLNHRQERDDCLERDAVLGRFGPSIVSAYDLYGDKVSPDLSSATRLFRDAVNDILGDGRPLL